MDTVEDDCDSTFESDDDDAPLIKHPSSDHAKSKEDHSLKDGGKRKCTTSRVVCTGFLLLMAMGFIFSGLLFLPWLVDTVYRYMVDHVTMIDQSSPVYSQWAHPSTPMYQSFHFFNLENPDAVIRGQRPRVTEKGPYVYRMTIDRDNVTFNKNGTVSFFTRFRYFFDSGRSVGPESDMITTVNAPLMTTAYKMKDQLFIVRSIVDGVVRELSEDVFIRRSVSEFLWGYEDALLKVANKFNPFTEPPPGFDTGHFGFCLGLNTSHSELYTVFTGKENKSLLSLINRLDGDGALSFWWSAEANDLQKSSDGSKFHPDIQKNETLYMYNPAMCRSMSFDFMEEVNYKSLPLLKFGLAPSTYWNGTANPANRGFCSGQQELCGPSGVMRQDPCRFGSPMAISNPHFLDGQQSLLDNVHGLSPSDQLHQSYFEVEPKTGLPFVMRFRVQVNMFIKPVWGLKNTGSLREMYLPLLWIQQSVEVDDQMVTKFKLGFVYIWTIATALQWILFGIGVLIIFVLLVKSAKTVVDSSKEESIQKSRMPDLIKIPTRMRGEDWQETPGEKRIPLP